MELILNDLLGFLFCVFCCWFFFFGGGSGIEPRTLYLLINTYSTTELLPNPSFFFNENKYTFGLRHVQFVAACCEG